MSYVFRSCVSPVFTLYVLMRKKSVFFSRFLLLGYCAKGTAVFKYAFKLATMCRLVITADGWTGILLRLSGEPLRISSVYLQYVLFQSVDCFSIAFVFSTLMFLCDIIM